MGVRPGYRRAGSGPRQDGSVRPFRGEPCRAAVRWLGGTGSDGHIGKVDEAPDEVVGAIVRRRPPHYGLAKPESWFL